MAKVRCGEVRLLCIYRRERMWTVLWELVTELWNVLFWFVLVLQWFVPRAYKLKIRQDPVTLMWLCKLGKPRSVPKPSLEIWILFGKRSSICKSHMTFCLETYILEAILEPTFLAWALILDIDYGDSHLSHWAAAILSLGFFLQSLVVYPNFVLTRSVYGSWCFF